MWKTCVSKNGYIVKKDTLEHADYRKARLHLVANPLTNEQYYTPNNQFSVYKDTKGYLYVPQNYGTRTFGKPDKQTSTYQGKTIKEKRAVFKGELKDNQKEPYEAIMKAVDEKGGGIVCLETGYGKTFISIKVITSVKRTTLVVVNKISLLEQWKSELATFAPELRVGQIQGQNLDIEEKDVIIGMLQSLTKCDYPEALFNDFGMVIFDEAHNIPSRKFSEVLFKVTCPVMIGLSATPKRADGLEKVLQWHIGDTIPISKTTKEERVPEIRVLKLKSEEYKEVRVYNKMTRQDQLNFTGMLTELIQMKRRNEFIVETIKEVMQNTKRKILVLTERRGHAQELKRLLDEKPVNFTYALFLGGMKIDYLNESRQQDVIIATIAAFAEGVSEKDLNTLILVSPKKFVSESTNSSGKRDNGKMEQIVGRIFRKEHTKETPALIIDLADQFSVFKSHSMQRCKFYRGHFKNIKIQYTIMDLDKHETENDHETENEHAEGNDEMLSDY
jgi:superfamily II DNA or RNA helicase